MNIRRPHCEDVVHSDAALTYLFIGLSFPKNAWDYSRDKFLFLDFFKSRQSFCVMVEGEFLLRNVRLGFKAHFLTYRSSLPVRTAPHRTAPPFTALRVSIKGLSSFSEGTPLSLEVKPADGSAPFEIQVNHTFNSEQIEWFKAGSALNLMKQANA